MNRVLHQRIATIYQWGTLLSLLLMGIATVELFLWGSGEEIVVPAVLPIVTGVLNGDAVATYYAAVVVLIFSPMINLLGMALTYLQRRDFRFTFVAIGVLIIILVAMSLKMGQ